MGGICTEIEVSGDGSPKVLRRGSCSEDLEENAKHFEEDFAALAANGK
jgi:hypothetical protein